MDSQSKDKNQNVKTNISSKKAEIITEKDKKPTKSKKNPDKKNKNAHDDIAKKQEDPNKKANDKKTKKDKNSPDKNKNDENQPQQQINQPQQQINQPQQQINPPQQQIYQPQQQIYQPQQQINQPQQQINQPQQQIYPPQQQINPPQQQIYPPQQQYDYKNVNVGPVFPGIKNKSSKSGKEWKVDFIGDVFDHLLSCEVFYLKEKISLKEILSNIEFNNKYFIHDENKQKVMKIKEKSTAIQRNCCCRTRSLKILFYGLDEPEKVLMELERKWYCSCCGIVGNNTTFVYVVNESSRELLAQISQGKYECQPRFTINVVGNEKIGDLLIEGPSCLLIEFQLLDTKFKIPTEMGDIIIHKEIKGADAIIKTLISDATNMKIKIPQKIKESEFAKDFLRITLASALVIDMVYFESASGENRGILGNELI